MKPCIFYHLQMALATKISLKRSTTRKNLTEDDIPKPSKSRTSSPLVRFNDVYKEPDATF